MRQKPFGLGLRHDSRIYERRHVSNELFVKVGHIREKDTECFVWKTFRTDESDDPIPFDRRLRNRDVREDGFDEGVRIGTGNGRFIGEADAVTEYFFRDGFDVFRNGVIATGNGREGFGGAYEADGSAGRSAIGDHLGVVVHSERRRIAGGGNEVCDVRIKFVVYVNFVFHDFSEGVDFFLAENFSYLGNT